MKKIVFGILAAAAFLASVVSYAKAEEAYTIRTDYGGSIITYIDKYSTIDQAQGRLKLDGFCISACTFFLGLVPPERTCATARSFLGFHSASDGMGQFSEEGTKLLWELYPPEVQTKLKEKGFDGTSGVAHPEIVYIRAKELMPECPHAAS